MATKILKTDDRCPICCGTGIKPGKSGVLCPTCEGWGSKKIRDQMAADVLRRQSKLEKDYPGIAGHFRKLKDVIAEEEAQLKANSRILEQTPRDVAFVPYSYRIEDYRHRFANGEQS